jgi:BON domain-containing protein
MTDPRTLPDDRPNIGTEPLEDEIAELQGEEPIADQDAVVSLDGILDEENREPALLDYEPGVPADPSLQSGETDDPLVAIEEGQTYVPPSDPPIVPAPDDPEGVAVPGSIDDDAAEGSLNRRVREALRADGATSPLADRLQIAVVGSTAIIRGQVDGLEDGDAIVEVASRVAGIDEVRDETEVPGL